MKFVMVIILTAFSAIIIFQVYSFLMKEKSVSGEFGDVSLRLEQMKDEQAKLIEELEYYKNPKNLEKEIKARFNYKEPGEKVLIVVPKNETTTKEN